MWERARDFFEEYCKKYEIKKEDDIKISISHKYYHTYRVVSWMEKLVKALELKEEEKDLAKVIAFFHDLGRFHQFEKEQEYNDAKNGFDHAKESIKELRRLDWFHHNKISKELEQIICFAIINHNKIQIENGTEKEIFYAKLLRDADKLAILEQNLKSDLTDLKISEEVLKSYENCELINYKICQNHADEKFAEMAYIFDFNFSASYHFVMEHKLLNPYYDLVFKTNGEKVEEKIKRITENYIKKKEGLLC